MRDDHCNSRVWTVAREAKKITQAKNFALCLYEQVWDARVDREPAVQATKTA